MLSRERVGRLMTGIGVAGIVISVLGVIVGIRLVDQVGGSVDDSLKLTRQALTSVQDSITVTRSMVTSVKAGLSNVSSTLGAVDGVLSSSSGALDGLQAFMSGELPDSIGAVNEVMPTIVDVAGKIDSALRQLSKVPFGPDYNPKVPFDQAIADVATALKPLPDQLRTMSDQLAGISTSTAQLTTDLRGLRAVVDELGTQLDSVDGLLDQYAATAARAQAIASKSRSDLGSSTGLAKLMVVLLGALFALSQIVPLWLGKTLTSRADLEIVDEPPLE